MAEEEQNPTTTPPAREPDDDTPSRGFVIAGCVAGCILFIGAVALLYFPWARGDTSNCLVTVLCSANYEDAVVTVSSLTGSMREPLTTIITREDGYRARIHVPTGTYSVIVRDRSGTQLYPLGGESRELIVLPEENRVILLGDFPVQKRNSP